MSNVNFRADYNSAKCSWFSKQNKSPLVGGVLQASKSYPNLGALLKASLLERPERWHNKKSSAPKSYQISYSDQKKLFTRWKGNKSRMQFDLHGSVVNSDFTSHVMCGEFPHSFKDSNALCAIIILPSEIDMHCTSIFAFPTRICSNEKHLCLLCHSREQIQRGFFSAFPKGILKGNADMR